MRFEFGDVVEGFFESKTCQFVLETQPGTHYQSEKMVSDYQSVPKFGVRFYTLEMHNY